MRPSCRLPPGEIDGGICLARDTLPVSRGWVLVYPCATGACACSLPRYETHRRGDRQFSELAT